MFKFVLAFIVWLFATGNYKAWAALLTSSATPSPAASSSTSSGTSGQSSQAGSGTSAASAASQVSGGSGLLGLLGGAVSSGSENTGASSTSTPDDLISGFSG